MKAEIRDFVRTYVKAIKESNAALFAGAGLSKPAGFVNWKELLSEVAEDLNLDIDKETDLISLAQFHVNERGRGKINQILLEEFTKDSEITENHRIISNLPIQTFWTTNYDTLIEDSLRAAGKRVDVKIRNSNLAVTLPNRQATVYKMHGDISLPDEAVITKDDYENYQHKRKPFTLALQGDLIEKTFLFIGFSFDDPNLQYVLSRIRILLGESQRDHYCFMKKVSRSDFPKGNEHDDDYRYAVIRQELQIKDLKRFRIQVILVDDYSEITEILRYIENKIRRLNVFISGSVSDYGEWGESRIFNFSTQLAKRLISNDQNIITGFGLGIGSCVISGALEEIYSNPRATAEKRLLARPFPQVGTSNLKEIWTRYRFDMISRAGISVFLFGNKIHPETGITIEADGMIEEFNISVQTGSIPVPIGATGYTARTIWNKVIENFDDYVPDSSLKPLYEEIGNENNTDEKIIDCVLEIVRRLDEYKY